MRHIFKKPNRNVNNNSIYSNNNINFFLDTIVNNPIIKERILEIITFKEGEAINNKLSAEIIRLLNIIFLNDKYNFDNNRHNSEEHPIITQIMELISPIRKDKIKLLSEEKQTSLEQKKLHTTTIQLKKETQNIWKHYNEEISRLNNQLIYYQGKIEKNKRKIRSTFKKNKEKKQEIINNKVRVIKNKVRVIKKQQILLLQQYRKKKGELIEKFNHNKDKLKELTHKIDALNTEEHNIKERYIYQITHRDINHYYDNNNIKYVILSLVSYILGIPINILNKNGSITKINQTSNNEHGIPIILDNDTYTIGTIHNEIKFLPPINISNDLIDKEIEEKEKSQQKLTEELEQLQITKIFENASNEEILADTIKKAELLQFQSQINNRKYNNKIQIIYNETIDSIQSFFQSLPKYENEESIQLLQTFIFAIYQTTNKRLKFPIKKNEIDYANFQYMNIDIDNNLNIDGLNAIDINQAILSFMNDYTWCLGEILHDEYDKILYEDNLFLNYQIKLFLLKCVYIAVSIINFIINKFTNKIKYEHNKETTKRQYINKKRILFNEYKLDDDNRTIEFLSSCIKQTENKIQKIINDIAEKDELNKKYEIDEIKGKIDEIKNKKEEIEIKSKITDTLIKEKIELIKSNGEKIEFEDIYKSYYYKRYIEQADKLINRIMSSNTNLAPLFIEYNKSLHKLESAQDYKIVSNIINEIITYKKEVNSAIERMKRDIKNKNSFIFKTINQSRCNTEYKEIIDILNKLLSGDFNEDDYITYDKFKRKIIKNSEINRLIFFDRIQKLEINKDTLNDIQIKEFNNIKNELFNNIAKYKAKEDQLHKLQKIYVKLHQSLCPTKHETKEATCQHICQINKDNINAAIATIEAENHIMSASSYICSPFFKNQYNTDNTLSKHVKHPSFQCVSRKVEDSKQMHTIC